MNFVFFLTQIQLRDIINTAQNLVLMLSNSVPARQGTSGEAAVGQGVQSLPTARQPQQAVQQLTKSQNNVPSVKQEMAR